MNYLIFLGRIKSLFSNYLLQTTAEKYNILLDENHNPLGGKWTYDFENRKKYPKGKLRRQTEFLKIHLNGKRHVSIPKNIFATTWKPPTKSLFIQSHSKRPEDGLISF